MIKVIIRNVVAKVLTLDTDDTALFASSSLVSTV